MSTTTPGPTALPATDVPPPRIVTGVPVSLAHATSASEIVARAREHDRNGHDAVVAGVSGVLGAAPRGVVDLTLDDGTEAGDERHGQRWSSRVSSSVGGLGTACAVESSGPVTKPVVDLFGGVGAPLAF